MRSFLLGAALLSALTLPSAVRADDPAPIVVVVEAIGGGVDPVVVRAGLASELHVPVLSVIEAMNRPSVGMLSIAVTDNGRHAVINYVPSDGTRYAVLISVEAAGHGDHAGEWLVAPAASAIRTSEERRAASNPTPELLDPWLAVRVLPPERRPSGIPSEVIDPFVGQARRRVPVVVNDYYLGPEVIDPWAEAVQEYRREQAEHLARPRARRGRRP